MNTAQKKILLQRFFSAWGICSITAYYVHDIRTAGTFTFDLLDSSRSSHAGFCNGSKNEAISFLLPYEFRKKLRPWAPVDDPYVLECLVKLLDKKDKWKSYDGTMFFNGMRPRIAIDLHGFSWETLAINLDLMAEEEFYGEES